LDNHFAVGNFIRDALLGGPIRVAGDGTPYRSYLYAADLAIWLWWILLRGESCRPYNVGSEESISIGDLARTVAGLCQPEASVLVAQEAVPGRPVERYVPSTQRARGELGFQERVGLRDAIERTMAWNAQQATAHTRH
jgi:dTDP-glucose 4,6-dehydratase